jgi:hypothetical protein
MSPAEKLYDSYVMQSGGYLKHPLWEQLIQEEKDRWLLIAHGVGLRTGRP